MISIIMGSKSDDSVMRDCEHTVNWFGVPLEYLVISAHRTPEKMVEYAKKAKRRGIKVIIAGAGGAAHLPGMVAALTTVPVIGVPISGKLMGVDSLLSIVQMPRGVPVATVGVDSGTNAGLLAVRILAVGDKELEGKLINYAASY